MKRRLAKRIAWVLLVVFIGIQFIRPEKNNGSAHTSTDITNFMQVPDTVMRLLENSCYDCHSNHTNYPWYFQVSPMSLMLANHIKNGKKELNFSDFSMYNIRRMKSKLASTAEQVEKREMPLKSYLLMHGDARLNDNQIKLITDWTENAKAQLDQNR